MRDDQKLGELILGMRTAFQGGGNAMAWARNNITHGFNSSFSALVAYDLQSGGYVSYAQDNPKWIEQWTSQLASLIRPYVQPGSSVLEVGVGEATTLAGVMKELNSYNISALGFDISWSRISVANKWISKNEIEANLFVGDLFHIPLADNSVDVVYTSHSLEPNGGKEKEAINELLRIARKAVVIVEPCYELANEDCQKRMLEHGYVRGLKEVAENLDANITEYGLLDVTSNPLNPSGVLILTKNNLSANVGQAINWQCPLTGLSLEKYEDIYYSANAGIAYPIMRSIPLLRQEHAVIASIISK
jgi:hypothetical protein